MTPEQVRWLTWGAIQHRPAGAPRWDEPGTTKAIGDVCGSWELATATEHVLAHARDPKARTPFAIKGSAPHHDGQRAPRTSARRGDDCPNHPGEWAGACRSCAADRLAGDEPPSRPTEAADPTPYIEQARAALRHQENS